MAPNMRNRMVNCRTSEKRFMIGSSPMECLGQARVCADWFTFLKLFVAVCQTSRPPTIAVYHMRQRLSSRAFAITLTELRAMAAPATTGLR